MTTTTFSLELPADATWAPMEFSDLIEQDGIYSAVIVNEKPAAPDAEKQGVWFTFELQDPDVKGKRVQKFLQDPRQNNKVTFLWRGLIMSMAGIEYARGPVNYSLGMFVGQPAYVKIGGYTDKDGRDGSSIDGFQTKEEFGAAVAANKHRWPRVARQSGPKTTPTGLPTLPGAAGLPMPGNFPMATGAAAPVASAPLPNPPAAPQPVAQQAPAAIPQPAAPAPFAFGQQAPAAAPATPPASPASPFGAPGASPFPFPKR